MNNPRPTLTMRKKVQLMILLTLLAWATQTLFHQWGFGQEVQARPVDRGVTHVDLDSNTTTVVRPAPAPVEGEEKFLPGTARFAAGATLEMRPEARVVGAEVKLRQVCRWPEADREVFEPLGDVVLFRLYEKTPFLSVTLPQIKQSLRDAGANLAVIRFSGPTSCTVSRSDLSFNEGDALQKWADTQLAKANSTDKDAPKAVTATAPAAAATTLPTATDDTAGGGLAQVDEGPIKTLRSMLLADLSQRLMIPREQLQLSFNPRDDKVLKLAEPVFRFTIDGKRVRNLGSVQWDVTLNTADGAADPQVLTIAANARAWQQQVVLSRPLSYKQVIRAEDLTERRTIVDRLPDDTLLTSAQILGQQAARDLKPGTVMSAKMVSAVPLVAVGQFVTVTLERGNVKVKTVARAMEGGSFGQTVRVKNEATKDIYEVTLTGPQEGTIGSDAVAKAPAAKSAKPERDIASVGND